MHSRLVGFTVAAAAVLALLLTIAPTRARAYDDPYATRSTERYEHHERGYNDEYIFSTTKMVADWDVDAAVKVPFFPPAVIIDVVFLPAEVIAGFF